ncbi:hypothetical protein ACWIUD_01430 [Helicobacter sp. 23-1044]
MSARQRIFSALGALMQSFGEGGFVWFYIANLVFLIAFAVNKAR